MHGRADALGTDLYHLVDGDIERLFQRGVQDDQLLVGKNYEVLVCFLLAFDVDDLNQSSKLAVEKLLHTVINVDLKLLGDRLLHLRFDVEEADECFGVASREGKNLESIFIGVHRVHLYDEGDFGRFEVGLGGDFLRSGECPDQLVLLRRHLELGGFLRFRSREVFEVLYVVSHA